jgi:hypothetical protein
VRSVRTAGGVWVWGRGPKQQTWGGSGRVGAPNNKPWDGAAALPHTRPRYAREERTAGVTICRVIGCQSDFGSPICCHAPLPASRRQATWDEHPPLPEAGDAVIHVLSASED